MEALTAALSVATTDAAMRDRAGALAQLLAAEQGVDRAVERITHLARRA